MDKFFQKKCKLVLTSNFDKPRTLFTDAGWSSSVARRAHNPKARGSNPLPATKKSRTYRLVACESFFRFLPYFYPHTIFAVFSSPFWTASNLLIAGARHWHPSLFAPCIASASTRPSLRKNKPNGPIKRPVIPGMPWVLPGSPGVRGAKLSGFFRGAWKKLRGKMEKSPALHLFGASFFEIVTPNGAAA